MDIATLDAVSVKEWMQNNDGIILFHKKLCPNCKVMHKVLQKVLLQEPDMIFASIDTEEQSEILPEFGVERAPTLVVCKGASVKAKKAGLLNAAEILALYNSN